MHPVLFEVGSFPVYTYGCFMFLAFTSAFLLGEHLGLKIGVDAKRIEIGALGGFSAGIIGAKLLYIITRLDETFAEPQLIWELLRNGLVFYGAPLLMIPFVVWYTRRYSLPGWKILDITMLCVTLGHAVGRLGCFAAGCCYGKPTQSIFAVHFHDGLVPIALRGIGLHPTQLYSAVSLFVFFGFLFWMYRRKHFDGQIFFSYLIIYPVIRVILEFFRGDVIRGFVIEGALSTSQFISILVFACALSGLLYVRKRSEDCC